MKQQLEPLFTPWKIGNCEIKNRIVRHRRWHKPVRMDGSEPF